MNLWICFSLLTGYVDAAMRTALHLQDYDDIINPANSYALLGKYSLEIVCLFTTSIEYMWTEKDKQVLVYAHQIV